MATQTLVAPAEYLSMSFADHDREYVHGEIVERGMPTRLHSQVQRQLIFLFCLLARRFPLFAYPELRLAVQPLNIYRIPDISIFATEDPTLAVPDSPPLVAIEVASPDDRLTETLNKLAEYRAWGVDHIWLIDPLAKQLYSYDATGLHPVSDLSLPQYDFTLTLVDLGL
ncbi:MAG: Uma2 family endonuclease [Bryobacteraceae bacterium]|nr:Uma2 family endonuclease [Bryobacteraceae bacterium]